MCSNFEKFIDVFINNPYENFHIDEMGYKGEKTMEWCIEFFWNFIEALNSINKEIQGYPYLSFALKWTHFNRYLHYCTLHNFESLFCYSQIPTIWIMKNENIKIRGEYYEREIIDEKYPYEIYYRCVKPYWNIQNNWNEYDWSCFLFADIGIIDKQMLINITEELVKKNEIMIKNNSLDITKVEYTKSRFYIEFQVPNYLQNLEQEKNISLENHLYTDDIQWWILFSLCFKDGYLIRLEWTSYFNEIKNLNFFDYELK